VREKTCISSSTHTFIRISKVARWICIVSQLSIAHRSFITEDVFCVWTHLTLLSTNSEDGWLSWAPTPNVSTRRPGVTQTMLRPVASTFSRRPNTLYVSHGWWGSSWYPLHGEDLRSQLDNFALVVTLCDNNVIRADQFYLLLLICLTGRVFRIYCWTFGKCWSSTFYRPGDLSSNSVNFKALLNMVLSNTSQQ